MKKYKKLDLKKFKVAKLAHTLSIKGGVITNDNACGVVTTEINDVTIGPNSCANTECYNRTDEFNTCTPTNTVETRTGDSLQNN
ncbi:hypothetical protein [Kordia sp.]|uniref:hypothetical protein n=1 Tax=Kordia sp. TaxID=1965332 RepID=UPI003D6A4CF5